MLSSVYQEFTAGGLMKLDYNPVITSSFAGESCRATTGDHVMEETIKKMLATHLDSLPTSYARAQALVGMIEALKSVVQEELLSQSRQPQVSQPACVDCPHRRPLAMN